MGVGACCELWDNLWIPGLAFLCHGCKGKQQTGKEESALHADLLITKAFSKCKDNSFSNQIVYEGTSGIQ